MPDTPRHVVALVCLLLAGLVLSCRSDRTLKPPPDVEGEVSTPSGQSPAAVGMNRSTVTAEVMTVEIRGEEVVSITAKILDVAADEAYPSIAVVGNVYTLHPRYVYTESGTLSDDPRNIHLRSLVRAEKGQTIRAVIFYEHGKGWYISELIN